MDKDTAIQQIMQLVTNLNETADQRRLEFLATKLVLDVLDYCHREDFPPALVYTIGGLLSKNFAVEANEFGTTAPLKEVKMDDTTFQFAVAEVDSTLDDATAAFNLLKPRLNLYRKVVGL